MKQIVFALNYLISLLLISGCSLGLNPSLNPNLTLTPKVDPNVVSSVSNDAKSQQSRAEAAAGTKQKAFNIWWSNELLTALHLDGSKNCLQLVWLSTQELVVDVAAVPCPSSDQLLPANTVLFTLQWQNATEGSAYIKFLNRTVGVVNYDWDFPTAQVASLCSGSYQSTCQIPVANGFITGIR